MVQIQKLTNPKSDVIPRNIGLKVLRTVKRNGAADLRKMNFGKIPLYAFHEEKSSAYHLLSLGDICGMIGFYNFILFHTSEDKNMKNRQYPALYPVSYKLLHLNLTILLFLLTLQLRRKRLTEIGFDLLIILHIKIPLYIPCYNYYIFHKKYPIKYRKYMFYLYRAYHSKKPFAEVVFNKGLF